MKPSQYLKHRAYYEDLYDQNTVEICRIEEESLDGPLPEALATSEIGKKVGKIWTDTLKTAALWHVAGDRYAEREETIRRWMNSDRWKDEQMERVVAPIGINCHVCDVTMDVETKFMFESSPDKQQMMFLFRCPKCKSGRGIFQDGTEWQRPHPGSCKKCNIVLTRSYESNGEQAVTISRCRRCGYEERETLDLDPMLKPSADEELRFARDRERFCFSEEKGKEYIRSRRIPLPKMQVPSDEERKVRELAKQLKKISVLALEKILKSALSKEGYVRLKFQPPDMERDVIVKFSVHDEQIEREEHTSRYSLQRRIETALSETNWRLMSDGVHYRLGVLQGRLRGYEREEELMKLIQVREKKNV